ncbi:hypothetical protein NCTGTJJY_CDS0275 [Serratia phage 92A1]|nr:hypothetical protein NCTGTJJY_CDS0275 [Serratia phage 92A1]
MKLIEAISCARDGARIRRAKSVNTIVRLINSHLIRQEFTTELRWGVTTSPFIPTPEEVAAEDWVVIDEPYSEANDPTKQFTMTMNHGIIKKVNNYVNYVV